MNRQLVHRMDPSLRGLGVDLGRVGRHLSQLGSLLAGAPGLGEAAADAAVDIIDPSNLAGGPSANLPPWIYPPAEFENIDRSAYVTIPAILATPDTIILTFVVPQGRNGIINKISNVFIGGGWTEGTGDIVWRVAVNDGGNTYFVQGYEQILQSLGGSANPTQIAGFRIFEGQTISVVAINNPAGASGGVVPAGQRLGARLCGWFYPRVLEDEAAWI